jgi:hypothetical protein
VSARAPIKFVVCPHCGNPTRTTVVRRNDGPSGRSVLLFGLLAYLYTKPRKALLCEHCSVIFDYRNSTIPLAHYRWIFLILLVIAAVAITAVYFSY